MGLFFKSVTIYEHEFGLLFHDGKLERKLEPGRVRLRRGRDSLFRFSALPGWAHVSGQDMPTKDGGLVRCSLFYSPMIVDPVAYYRSGAGNIDTTQGTSFAFPLESEGLNLSVKALMRDWVAERTLEESLAQYRGLAEDIRAPLQAAAAKAGVEVVDVMVMDFSPAGGIRQAALDVLRSELEGKAALQRARNEAATMRSLINTARLVREHPGLLELRAFASGQRARITLNFNTASTGASHVAGDDRDSAEGPAAE